MTESHPPRGCIRMARAGPERSVVTNEHPDRSQLGLTGRDDRIEGDGCRAIDGHPEAGLVLVDEVEHYGRFEAEDGTLQRPGVEQALHVVPVEGLELEVVEDLVDLVRRVDRLDVVTDVDEVYPDSVCRPTDRRALPTSS